MLKLDKPKSAYAPVELHAIFSSHIASLPTTDCIHMYCDGSVSGDGRAGVAVLARTMDLSVMEDTLEARVSDRRTPCHSLRSPAGT